MKFSEFSDIALPEIENNIQECISSVAQKHDSTLYQMLRYHLGLTDKREKQHSQGKRIRPLILLLTIDAAGGNWKFGLPAAAAIELIHNFSLIHDDIEDQSEYRRGKLTLWKTHNLPLALNAGDAMFALSFICLENLIQNTSCQISFQAYSLISQACLSLTKGQHLDISFETKKDVSIAEYMSMIEGKTAALLANSSKIGALIAGADQKVQNFYYEFGKNLGFAFQIHDDILGIWGDQETTGKSTSSDLLARKKTLPILYGLSQNQSFTNMWDGDISPHNVRDLANQLKNEGAYEFAIKEAQKFTKYSLESLELAQPAGSAKNALIELIEILTTRTY